VLFALCKAAEIGADGVMFWPRGSRRSMSSVPRKIVSSPRWTIGLYGLFTLLSLTVSIVYLVEGDLLMAGLTGLGVVVFGVLASRAMNGGIFTEDAYLITRNEYGTKRFAWDDIDRFEYLGIRGFGFWGKDGKWTLLQYLPPSSDHVARYQQELSTELRRRQ
jgi:hypothetical protein